MNFYEQKFLKNPFSKLQQELIRKTKFTVIGLGGTGGFILENLLRLGAENLTVFDHDRFELSNFNRQTLATDDFLDMPKVHAALARAKIINKNIKISVFSHFDEHTKVSSSILLDGTDNIKSKLIIAQMARKKKIPFIFCSVLGTRGMVTTFTNYKFEDAFQLPKNLELKHYQTCSSIICPAASLAGSLAASQAVNFLLKKPYVCAPDALFFDLDKKDIFWRAKLG
ncbi:MAG: ThiF family adenylyltransferase [Candidatus Micrarchaeota archaeon]